MSQIPFNRVLVGLCTWLCCALLVTGCEDDTTGGEGGDDGNNAANNDTNNDANNDGNNDVNNDGPVCGDGQCDDGEDSASCPDDCEPPGPVCGDGQCDDGEDNANCPDDCEPPGPVCGDGQCDDGEDSDNCPDDCEAPPEVICEPGETRCSGINTMDVCNDDGTAWELTPCPVGQICDTNTNLCAEVTCRPGDVVSCASQNSIFVCNDTGTGQVEQPCEPDFFCDFVGGAFACTDQICEPGETRCVGETGNEICNEEGTDWVSGEVCADGTQCDEGACRSLCEINSKVSSFLGCEYWSADLDNIEGGTNAPHAVIISNPNDLPAVIEVFDSEGNPVIVNEWPTQVEPNTLATWTFDPNYINQTNNESVVDTDGVDGTIITDQTYQFISSIPVTAHQFNPLVDRNVFTNDASLLLPTNAIGNDYLIMSWKHRPSPVIRGFATVIAVGLEPTTVTVTPRAAVLAGNNVLDNTPIERIPTGETRQFVLQPGQLLNIETEGPEGADLTGTRVISDQPIVVFGGHECANVPLGFNFCDHIEQQMFPVDAWGETYIGTHFVDRDPNTPQREVWRIMASEDQTVLSTVPAIENVDGRTLNSGDFVEFETNTPFELEGTAPILVGQYMTGSSYTGGASIGDPAFTLASPIEQWRRDYIVLTPPAYNRGDYLNIVAPIGTTVLLDGEPVDGNLFESFGSGDYAVAQIPVEDGPHTLTAEEPFTVIPYGYDSAVSYAYPGGLNLESINR